MKCSGGSARGVGIRGSARGVGICGGSARGVGIRGGSARGVGIRGGSTRGDGGSARGGGGGGSARGGGGGGITRGGGGSGSSRGGEVAAVRRAAAAVAVRGVAATAMVIAPWGLACSCMAVRSMALTPGSPTIGWSRNLPGVRAVPMTPAISSGTKPASMEQRRQRVMTTEQRQPLRHRQPHHKFSWAARPGADMEPPAPTRRARLRFSAGVNPEHHRCWASLPARMLSPGEEKSMRGPPKLTVGSGACSFQSRAEAWVRLQTPAPGAATIQPEPSTGRG